MVTNQPIAAPPAVVSSAMLSKFRSIDMRAGLYPQELAIRVRVIDGVVHARVEMNEFPLDDLDVVLDLIGEQFDKTKAPS